MNHRLTECFILFIDISVKTYFYTTKTKNFSFSFNSAEFLKRPRGFWVIPTYL